MVESENGSLLWDAVVVDVSKDPSNGKVIGYLVHFKGWSSRFDSWVSRDRVVEANQANLNIQVRDMNRKDTMQHTLFAVSNIHRLI